MPQEIDFSIMAVDETGIRPLLDEFEAETNIHVRVTLLSWDTAWSTLVKNAIYGDGPDLSEVGSTWIGDLIGMNSLRLFSFTEVDQIAPRKEFLPAPWKPCTGSNGDIWAIPWLAGVRMIFFRPNLLEAAQVDPERAFDTLDHFEETLRRLKDAGTPIPWAVPTGLTHATLLNAASWVWAAGGDFLSPDLHSTCFLEPQALEGLAAYFRLGRFLGPDFFNTSSMDSDGVFAGDPGCAVATSGPWLLQYFDPVLQRDGRAALPPGPSFVGGSELVIWKHSPNANAALKLVRFLTSVPAQVRFSQSAGLLPVRLAALESQPFTTDHYWRVAVQALHTGRTFPIMKLWGLVEDRLSTAFWAIWNEILASPQSDPMPILKKLLSPLARRLDETLKS